MTHATLSFGQLLRNYRLAAGLTQEELAERARLSARAISDLERGVKVQPHHDTVELLAEALGLPPEELERAVPRRRGPRAFSTPARLPVIPTSFVGRDLETREVVTLLRQAETRLITVTGPPGIGKTRLTLVAAELALGDFADGVVFVPLVSVRDSALVPSSLAQALGVHRSSSISKSQRIVDHLQSRHLLLVVDNFEHLPDAAPFLARIVVSCPQVKLLVSSRAALNIQGEHRFDLGPLDFPPEGIIPALSEISRYSSLLLFAERAKAINPSFQITPNNLEAIVGICQRLNGLPLAIELASARSNVLTPQTLLKRLESQLQVLTGGPRDLPERHRTMRHAIAWSYDLLTDGERRLFRRLSYFVGGSSLEAIESMFSADDGEVDRVLDDLTSLVEKSLVLVRPGQVDESRFVMLEAIREFGMERLAENGELAVTADRHCGYFVDLVEHGYSEQVGDKQSLWFRRLEQEQGNLRLAARWIVENMDERRAVRFGLNLWRFWDRGHIQEGRDWLCAFLLMPCMAAPNSRRCPLLFAAGRLAYRQADYAAATLLLQESVAIARAENDMAFVSAALTQLGHVAYAQGRLNDAERQYAESLTIRRVGGDARTIGISLHGLARVQRARGDYAGARALLDERLAYARGTHDALQISMAVAGLGLVALLEGDHEGAESLYRESLNRALEVDDQPAVSTALLGLALAAIGCGEPARARPLLHESLRIAREVGGRHLIAQSLEGFAAMLAASGQARRSWRLAAAVAAYRAREEIPGDPGERVLLTTFLDHAAQSLDPAERTGLWATGRGMTLSDAFAEIGLTTPSSQPERTTPMLADMASVGQQA